MVLVAGALDVRVCGRPNPVFRDNLAAAPATALEKKLSQLRHVPRVQLEVAPAVVVTLRVGGPRHVVDAERSE